MKKENKKQAIRMNLKKISFIACGVVAAYILALFLPFISPYAWYPIKLVQCGHKPIIASKFAASWSYMTPENKYYGVTWLDNPRHFYCKTEQAEKAGFRRTVLGE